MHREPLAQRQESQRKREIDDEIMKRVEKMKQQQQQSERTGDGGAQDSFDLPIGKDIKSEKYQEAGMMTTTNLI